MPSIWPLQSVSAIAGASLLAVALAFGPATAATSKTYRVAIRDMTFGPPPAGLKVGDTVEWANEDIFAHTVTTRDRRYDLVLPAGKKGRSVMTRVGAIVIYCRFHPGMTTTLVVSKK